MKEYKFLFCFSGDINNLINTISVTCNNLGYNVIAEKVDSGTNLFQLSNIDSYDTIIVQEYFDVDEPIKIDYLNKLNTIKNFNLVCIFEEDKRKTYSQQLYNSKLYNCYFGNDATKLNVEEFVHMLINGRTQEEAQKYYDIKINTEIKECSTISMAKKIENTVKLYIKDEETLVYEIEKLIEVLNDYELRMLITELEYSIVESLLCIPRIYNQYKKIAKSISPNKVNRHIADKSRINDDIKYIPVNCKNIGVVNLSRGAGATFFTMNFACAIAEYMKVSVVEHPLLKPYIYLSLGLNTLCFEGYVDFTSFAHLIDTGENVNEKYYTHNTNKNISWIITDATKEPIESWNSTKMIRLLYTVKDSTLNIVDLGDKLFDSSIVDIVEQFSMIIVIIDPMVPELINSIDNLEKIKKLQKNRSINIQYVINKYNKGIDKSELLDFLDVKPLAYIPFIEPKYVYGAVYDGTVQYNNSNVKALLYPPFKKIIENIIPKEALGKKSFWKK